MPEENLNKKEDIMLPEPTTEQVRLWDKIEESLNEEITELEVKFQTLSDELKTHFASIQTAENIRTIGKKHQLSEKSVWWLSHTVGMVLLGETNIVDFVKTLQEKCGLAEEPARQIARDINQAILLPVKESLKKIHQVPEWPREEQVVERSMPLSLPKTPTPKEPTLPSARKDIYQEPIEEATQPNQIEPKINGNVVDLKNK